LDKFSLTNQYQAFDALAAITAQDFGQDAVAWKAWWTDQP